MNGQEAQTFKLPWDEVCKIISTKIEQVTGIQVQCRARVAECEFWAVELTGRHLSLPQFCQLIQSLQPTPDDWEDALPDEVMPDIREIGLYTGEKILRQNLHIAWEHRVIAKDALWLVGVSELGVDGESRPTNLEQALSVIADHLQQQEDV